MYLIISGYAVGALGSCCDPDIILEVLNFLLTSEVCKFRNAFVLCCQRR